MINKRTNNPFYKTFEMVKKYLNKIILFIQSKQILKEFLYLRLVY